MEPPLFEEAAFYRRIEHARGKASCKKQGVILNEYEEILVSKDL